MYLATILTGLLSSLTITLSAPLATTPELYGEPYNCGYVLTIRNSSAYAGISAYPPAQAECTAIYYNDTIPGYQDAYAYSLFGGCECSFHLTEDDCKGATDPPMYEGPTGDPGEEPCFEDPNPKWYRCATLG
ncbi:hypothetical protein J4E85_007938 [Alternaria conjuncta]|uniref:uncharacterized protein n=1 Tax=Alternaria conjuncta TaxID=181017 RepID=UPI00221E8A5D|nr:uncharacterized protein J4E85_007938 [Alternaria conjuncta]KAI4924821.1 hypothetical protein J4E85_007938 [Alternaria conjuncta]